MKIVVFLPNWIGDVVMATPTLRSLRLQFPDDRLLGVMRPSAIDVLAGTTWLDEIIPFDRKSRKATERGWAVAKQLRKYRVDTAVLLTNSLSTAMITWLGGVKNRVGYVRHGRRWLLNRRLYPPRQGRKLVPVSQVDYYLKLAASVGCADASRRLELVVTRDEAERAERIWNHLGLASQRVVVFNTGGQYGEAKHWPTEYFATVAKQLVRAPDVSVLVICGPAERGAAEEIERLTAHPRVVSLARQATSIGLSKACVKRSSLLLTTDSGPRHFAAAFGVPVVTLFGSKDPAWSETFYDRATHLRLDLPCSPCGKRTCPLKHYRCMRDLSVEIVYNAVQQRLEQTVTSLSA